MSAETAPVVVRAPAGVHVFLWTVLPTAGAAVGLALAQLPGWVSGLPRIRNIDLLAELAAAIGTWSTVGLIVAGALVGAVLALMAYDDVASVEVGARDVVIRRGDEVTATLAREDVAAALVERKELVLLDADGDELARERTDLETAELRAAFESHGCRWRTVELRA